MALSKDFMYILVFMVAFGISKYLSRELTAWEDTEGPEITLWLADGVIGDVFEISDVSLN